jgi:hypothetical protein
LRRSQGRLGVALRIVADLAGPTCLCLPPRLVARRQLFPAQKAESKDSSLLGALQLEPKMMVLAALVCVGVVKAAGVAQLGFAESWEMVQLVNSVYEVMDSPPYNHFVPAVLFVLLKMFVFLMALVGLLQWRWYGIGPRTATPPPPLEPQPRPQQQQQQPLPNIFVNVQQPQHQQPPDPVQVQQQQGQPAPAPRPPFVPGAAPADYDPLIPWHDGFNDPFMRSTTIVLREELKARDLPTTGLKLDLVRRLREHDDHAPKITDAQKTLVSTLAGCHGVAPTEAEKTFKDQAARYIARMSART